MKTRDLTTGERVLLLRRRNDESQREAADRHEVSLYRFRRWEADQEQAPVVAIGRMAPHEQCFIRRKRSGVTVAELALRLGVSRWWLIQMEYGRQSTETLEAFWSSRKAPPALAG